MASDELRRLWKLHQIDAGILEIRKRAAALDPGRKIQAEIQALEATLNSGDGSARQLSAELTDLELAQKTLDEKIKKIEKDLYSGKIVNPREVADFQQEIAMFKRQRGAHDDRIMKLWEVLPDAQKTADVTEKTLAEKKKELVEHQKSAMKLKAQLEEDFKRLNAERPAVAKTISAPLLARYENTKQRHATGMAAIVKGRSCGGCGTLIAERTLQAVKDDKLVTCEECHRILYYSEGLV